jgi:hypothetical protein
MEFETRLLSVKTELTKVFAFADRWIDRCDSFEPGSFMREQSHFLLLSLLNENKTWLSSIKDLRIERVYSNDDQPAVTNLLPLMVEVEDVQTEEECVIYLKKQFGAQLNELTNYIDLLTFGTQNYRVILTLSPCNELEVTQFVALFTDRMQGYLQKLDSLTENFSLSATTS